MLSLEWKYSQRLPMYVKRELVKPSLITLVKLMPPNNCYHIVYIRNCVGQFDLNVKRIAQSAGVEEYIDCITAAMWVRPPNKDLGYDTKSDGEDQEMLEFWGMRSTPSLPSLLAPLWPWVVAPDRVLFMGQIDLNCVFMLNWIVWIKTLFTFNCV